MIKCDTCGILPEDNDDIFFNTRYTKTGKYYSGETKDLVLCTECLKTSNLKKLQSAVRIENLEMS